MPEPLNRNTLVRIFKIGLALFWLALFAATHVPVNVDLMTPEGGDKFEHFGAYMLLALLAATTWQLAVGVLNARHLVLVWLLIVAYGAFDEVTQIPVGRDCDFWDWTADASGAACGLIIFLLARRQIAKR